jgi:hypothetical protein
MNKMKSKWRGDGILHTRQKAVILKRTGDDAADTAPAEERNPELVEGK